MEPPPPKNDTNPIMMVAIVQSQDVDRASNALIELNLSVTRLPSIGGFLRQRNATLLISVPKGKEKNIRDALNKNCRERLEFIAVPLESAPIPLPAPTPITVGGATIFTLDVDHFEEY